ncbi:unnamed protein product [Darwinula stevensoni]|uniref:Adiponectin receptor protein n=1 Tax=Darwinula stevensoni TaxID=69355 RepID=A0A7R9AA04_9CRUS|nr:unnamed protein product [Darwinula stevensoni]CAG0897950.1 unnamed protein product [Darwinula stevensoni]
MGGSESAKVDAGKCDEAVPASTAPQSSMEPEILEASGVEEYESLPGDSPTKSPPAEASGLRPRQTQHRAKLSCNGDVEEEPTPALYCGSPSPLERRRSAHLAVRRRMPPPCGISRIRKANGQCAMDDALQMRDRIDSFYAETFAGCHPCPPSHIGKPFEPSRIMDAPASAHVRHPSNEMDLSLMAHQAMESAGLMAHHAVESAEDFVRKVCEEAWQVVSFHHLPSWLKDNDFLHHWHRPPLPSFAACFRSIFRVHTETGNIWTHLLGCVAFIAMATYYLTRPSIEVQMQEKLVFAAFFLGAILCLGFSFTFHTVHCHSEFVGKLFSKLDYCGIALLITGSFVPWLYYGFYCEFQPKLIYLTAVVSLGISAMIVSLWDKFSEPQYRWLRAGVFMGFGLSGIIPAMHYLSSEGWFKAVSEASLGSLLLMGFLYIMGALCYASRIPERFFPGKCDIWFQSHQIFHVLVIAAAFVHYHGISEMAMYRLTTGECQDHGQMVL